MDQVINTTAGINKDSPGHVHRKKSAAVIIEEIRKSTKNTKVHELLDILIVRYRESCEGVASYCDEIPRAIGSKNMLLRDVFQQVAESIRDIPDNPAMALKTACLARYDASRIPLLSDDIRRAGYEEGYRTALKKSNNFVEELDINID